ncbi:hypothetical protein [Alteromonas sp. KUL49]|uniref:hypothetical protein n=1 Tax=Alteromonas sp. KUL49 TaxID=2480798 RepID=UPI00102F21AF|nr:hypothetical protein [Alteromonas sp. KUL49]TAP40712.1 hypothetical protein EYS00_06235 [Alteromonas sp. KUL49]
MKRFVAVFKIAMLVLLGLLSIKMMYSSPITGETESVSGKNIEHLDCPIGKYAKPFFTISGSQTKFYVMKLFVHQTRCNNDSDKIIGKNVSFVYFNNSDGKSEVIQLSLDGKAIYTESEFVGRRKSMGALVFLAIVGYSIWLFVSSKKA